MSNLQIFIIAYDRIYNKVVDQLTASELESITCYGVQKRVPKAITPLIRTRVNEWELPWNDYGFQTRQYYEYSSMVHLYKNLNLIEKLSHIGILHYDVIFNVNSVNEIKQVIEVNPNTIFYQKIRSREQLSLHKHEVDSLCALMGKRMGITIDSDLAWNNGWISEALSITPKAVLCKFAKFIHDHGEEIEYILRHNVGGIMNHCPHRICGIVERLWGFYLVSSGMDLKPMNVTHDWDSYQHRHMSMNGTGVATI